MLNTTGHKLQPIIKFSKTFSPENAFNYELKIFSFKILLAEHPTLQLADEKK